MPQQQLDAQQLATFGINGTTDGYILVEFDGDPTNPAPRRVLVKANRLGTRAPNNNDDQTQGYAPGSLWVNVVANRFWFCTNASTGAAIWVRVGSFSLPTIPTSDADLANLLSLRPGRLTLGDMLRYGPEGAPTASSIQYTRIFLSLGTVLDRMETFVSSGGTLARFVRIGLYAQADPLNPIGVPVTRVAQTNALETSLDNGLFKALQLTNAPTGGSGAPTPYTVTSEGYYWVAFITDSGVLKHPSTVQVYRPGFIIQFLTEASVETTLPAAATPVTPPASAILYAAAVLQGA